MKTITKSMKINPTFFIIPSGILLLFLTIQPMRLFWNSSEIKIKRQKVEIEKLNQEISLIKYETKNNIIKEFDEIKDPEITITKKSKWW